MSAQPKQPAIPEPVIPELMVYRIKHVTAILGVPAYVVHYWESQFPQLKPERHAGNQRWFRRKDVLLLLEIKRLLYVERFTIEGARRQLALRGKTSSAAKTLQSVNSSEFTNSVRKGGRGESPEPLSVGAAPSDRSSGMRFGCSPGDDRDLDCGGFSS